jgi:hypothetical protein
LEYTEEFDNAVWGKLGTTITANTTTSPNGTTTADTLSESGANEVHAINQNKNFVSGENYTISCYLKKGGGTTAPNWIQITFGSAAFGSSQYANFNLSTGSVGTVVGGTADIEGIGSGWYRVSFSATATTTTTAPSGVIFNNNSDATGRVPGYLGAVTSDVYIWGAQLEEGSTATNYQRVGSFLDVSEEGKARRGRLWYNGTSHFMQTGTITPGTDKVQVFAGVRKLSDAANGMLIELGAYSLNSFRLECPPSTLDGRYRFSSYGSLGSFATTPANYASPHTDVLAAASSISDDYNVLRVNGATAATSSSDQGTGNYLAYPLYFGARAGTSLFFNGYEDTSIIRFGPNLDAGTISKVESYVASKTPEETI